MNFRDWETGMEIEEGKGTRDKFIDELNASLKASGGEKSDFDKRLEKIAKAYKKGEDIKSLLTEIVEEIQPIANERDKSWEMGAQNYLRGCILALIMNPDIKSVTLSKVKKLSGIGNLDENRVYLLRNYFKTQPEEVRVLVDSVINNSENTARNLLCVLFTNLARV